MRLPGSILSGRPGGAARDDHDRALGEVQQLVRHAAEGDQRKIVPPGRADHDGGRADVVGRGQDGPRHVSDPSLADLGVCGDAAVPQGGREARDDVLALAGAAVHLKPAESPDGELVNVQDEDPVTGCAEVPGGSRRLECVVLGVGGQQDDLLMTPPPRFSRP